MEGEAHPDAFRPLEPAHPYRALGTDNPTWRRNRSGGEGNEFYGGIQQIVRYAVGGVDGLPPTGANYFLFYAKDIEAATPGSSNYVPEYKEAMSWLAERLRRPDRPPAR